MACIYRHLKPNGEVFYIGIGKSKNRAYSNQSRSKHWHNVVKKHGYEIQILKENLEWQDARFIERILIDWYGRKDKGLGTLINMTNGGEGCEEYEEVSREKIRKAQLGRKRPDLSNYNKSIVWDEERRSNLSKKMIGKIAYNKGLKGVKPETSKRMSESAKNRERIKCPYCEVTGIVSNMNRWHFNNCKKKLIDSGQSFKGENGIIYPKL